MSEARKLVSEVKMPVVKVSEDRGKNIRRTNVRGNNARGKLLPLTFVYIKGFQGVTCVIRLLKTTVYTVCTACLSQQTTRC